jgi:hypothetical protein
MVNDMQTKQKQTRDWEIFLKEGEREGEREKEERRS